MKTTKSKWAKMLGIIEGQYNYYSDLAEANYFQKLKFMNIKIDTFNVLKTNINHTFVENDRFIKKINGQNESSQLHSLHIENV